MLQRFLGVDRDGSISLGDDPKILFSVMMNTRVELALGTKYGYLFLLTPALRYSVVRRQFRNISGQKLETKLLDYQTQQMKLFP